MPSASPGPPATWPRTGPPCRAGIPIGRPPSTSTCAQTKGGPLRDRPSLSSPGRENRQFGITTGAVAPTGGVASVVGAVTDGAGATGATFQAGGEITVGVVVPEYGWGAAGRA